jgi:hypothetical protein
MDPVHALLAVIVAIAAFDLAAVTRGTDSRDGFDVREGTHVPGDLTTDDRARP